MVRLKAAIEGVKKNISKIRVPFRMENGEL